MILFHYVPKNILRICASIPFFGSPSQRAPNDWEGWMSHPPSNMPPSWSATYLLRPKVIYRSQYGHMAIHCDRHDDLIGFSKTWMGMVQKLYFCIFRWDEHPQAAVLVSRFNKIPWVSRSSMGNFRGQGRTGPQFHGALLDWKFLRGCRCGLCRSVEEDEELGGRNKVNEVVRNGLRT